MLRISRNTLILISVFSIAMAFFESAVVIYLQAVFYPFGFRFPLPPMTPGIATTEVVRELATLVMLISFAVLVGKTHIQRFGYFLFSFAIWDIFYYIFLKVFINWPTSLFEWDILFLIPVVWASPVICPVIVSISMLILAFIIIIGTDKGKSKLIKWYVWALLALGSLFILSSFMLDNLAYMSNKLGIGELMHSYIKGTRLMASRDYYPGPFNWSQFIMGELMIMAGIFLIIYYAFFEKKNIVAQE